MIELYNKKIERIIAKGGSPQGDDVKRLCERIVALGGVARLLIKDEPLSASTVQENKGNGRKSKKTVEEVVADGVELAADGRISTD
jgi:hypothetical protein